MQRITFILLSPAIVNREVTSFREILRDLTRNCNREEEREERKHSLIFALTLC